MTTTANVGRYVRTTPVLAFCYEGTVPMGFFKDNESILRTKEGIEIGQNVQGLLGPAQRRTKVLYGQWVVRECGGFRVFNPEAFSANYQEAHTQP